MEVCLWQIEGMKSGTHSTPEQLRLPFHTSKRSQCIVQCPLHFNFVCLIFELADEVAVHTDILIVQEAHSPDNKQTQHVTPQDNWLHPQNHPSFCILLTLATHTPSTMSLTCFRRRNRDACGGGHLTAATAAVQLRLNCSSPSWPAAGKRGRPGPWVVPNLL